MDWTAKLNALADDERALMATIAKTWLAKGEDPSIVAGHVKAWLDKNSDDGGGEGSKPPRPTEELEALVNAHMATHKVKRTAAYSAVLQARPDLNAALARHRDAKLHKAAQAFGGGYGMR